MRDNLKQIIEIRARKRDRVYAAEQSQQAEVRNAEARLRAVQEEIREFQDELKTLEADLLKDLVGKEVGVDDILMVEQALRKAADHAKSLSDTADQIIQEIDECHVRLENIRRQRVGIERRLNNISEVAQETWSRAKRVAIQVEDAAEEEIMEAAYMAGRHQQ